LLIIFLQHFELEFGAGSSVLDSGRVSSEPAFRNVGVWLRCRAGLAL